MSRKKSALRMKKNHGTPANRKKAADRNLARRRHNAAIKYGCTETELKSCHVIVPRLHFERGRLYQQIVIDGTSHVLKRPRVLSLFDGISSGLVALQKMGIKPQVYFSSEIDRHCLKLQRFNFKDDICQLGDVCELSCERLKELGSIDLLFGGSPCNDLSRVNPNRKGLHGEGGTGILFWEFVRIMAYFRVKAQLENRVNDFYWFFENTFCMDAATKETISEYLNCQPIELCSSMFVPMKRRRYFWTNIPISETELRSVHDTSGSKDPKCILQNYLCGSGRKAVVDILPTVTSNRSNLEKGGRLPVVDDHDGPGHLHYSEIELLFGFPLNYTAGPNTTLQLRKQMISKSCDIHSITFILKSLIDIWVLKPMT